MSTDATKNLAFAVADWLQNAQDSGADATKLREAAKLVSEAYGVNASDAKDRAEYAQGSPGLQAIFDVFLKTQKRMGAPEAAASNDAAKKSAPGSEDAAKADQLKNDGNKYMSAKDYGAALDAYTKAIELNAGSPVFYSNRAAAYSQIGQHDEAVADARKAIEIDPKFSKAYSRLGHALFASGQYEEARDAYEKGLEIDPSNKLMKSGLDTSKSKLAASALSARSPNEGGDADAGAGGMPGAGAGAGGMPDLSSLMNNPMLSQMAQNMCVADAALKLTPQDAERRRGAADEQPHAPPDGRAVRPGRTDARHRIVDEQPANATVRDPDRSALTPRMAQQMMGNFGRGGAGADGQP